ncbi:MAG TPA: SRPBCC family protein [Mycobacterium sp.]
MVQVAVQRTICAWPEEVFAWLTDPVNLTAAPLFLRAGWANGVSGPSVGARREVIVLGAWLREEITAYDAPRSYSYRVIRSVPPANHEGGTVTLTASGDGTDATWATGYTVPALAGGKITEAVTLPIFRSSFQAILAGCAKALER